MMSGSLKSWGVFRPLLRGLPLIIGLTVLSLLIAKKYLRYATPEYESTVKIKLADAHEGVSNSNLFKDFDLFASANKIGAEVELLKSTSLIGKIISELPLQTSVYRVGDIHKTELYKEAPFYIRLALTNSSYYGQVFSIVVKENKQLHLRAPDGTSLTGSFGELLKGQWGAVIILKNDSLLKSRPSLQLNDSYEFVAHTSTQQIAAISKELDVMAVDKDIPVVRISYKCPVAQKSADIVNALAAAYISDYIEEKFRSADTTAEFLDKQLKEYSRKLSASESSIEQFRTHHNIVNIPQETETDLRKIADLKKQLASVQMNLNAIDTLHEYIKKGKDHFLELAPNFEAFTDLLSTEMIKKTKELQGEKHELLTRYTTEHEKVKTVDRKLNDISAYLQESINNTEKNLRIKYNDLQETIHQSEQVFVGLPTREKQLTVMERNFGLNDQIYRFLHEKRTEAEIAKAATISFHRIISPGDIPVNPVSPNGTIIQIMALLLGFSGGVGLVYIVHLFKARVDNAEMIQRVSGIQVIGELPFFKKPELVSAFFRRWAIELSVKGILAPGSLIVCSSYSKNEGKGFCAIGLYTAIAESVQRVHYLDLSTIDPQSWLRPADWQNYLASLRVEYDVIIVRNLPIDLHPSSLPVMASATLNIVVLDSRLTHKDKIPETELLQQNLSLPALRFLLNRSGYNPSLFKGLIQFVKKINAKE